MNESDIIRQLARSGSKNFKAVICTVDSVNADDMLCDLLPVDGSAPIKKARLTARKGVGNTIVGIPKKGSYVIATDISENDVFVALYDEVESIMAKPLDTFKVETGSGDIHFVAGNKMVLKNNATSLKEVLNGLLTELKSATMGPYVFTPDKITAFENINTKINQLLKE